MRCLPSLPYGIPARMMVLSGAFWSARGRVLLRKVRCECKLASGVNRPDVGVEWTMRLIRVEGEPRMSEVEIVVLHGIAASAVEHLEGGQLMHCP